MAPSSSAPVATDAEPVTLVSDGDQLIAAVMRSPDDDAPRLAYADWLDENAGAEPCPQFGYDEGEPHFQCARCQGRGVVPNGNAERAEFIRVQIDLSHATVHFPPMVGYVTEVHYPAGSPVPALKEREGFLFHDLYARIVSPLVDLGIRIESIDFRRGFIEAIGMSAAHWIAHGDELIRRHPVREVTLTTWPGFFYLTTPDAEGKWVDTDEPWDEGPARPYSHETRVGIFTAKARYRWPSVKTWNLPPAPPQPQPDYRGYLDEMRRQIERGILGQYSDHLPLRPPGG